MERYCSQKAAGERMNLQSWLWYPLEDLPFLVIAIAIAFTFHEFAHAYSAYKFGDRTAYEMGRVTLNPRVHIDVLGAILILIAGFGWAKPVLVNTGRFKRPRLMGIVVSAVGPLSNLVIGVAAIVIVALLNQIGLLHAGSEGVYSAIVHFFYYIIYINLMLFVFNLIPIPPLDGYRILADLLPLKWRYEMEKHVHWGIIIFLVLLFIPQLYNVTLRPILSLSVHIMFGVMDFCNVIFPKAMDWNRFFIDFIV